MVDQDAHGERDEAPAEGTTGRVRRHRAARRPAGPPVLHHEPSDVDLTSTEVSQLGDVAELGAGDLERAAHEAAEHGAPAGGFEGEVSAEDAAEHRAPEEGGEGQDRPEDSAEHGAPAEGADQQEVPAPGAVEPADEPAEGEAPRDVVVEGEAVELAPPADAHAEHEAPAEDTAEPRDAAETVEAHEATEQDAEGEEPPEQTADETMPEPGERAVEAGGGSGPEQDQPELPNVDGGGQSAEAADAESAAAELSVESSEPDQAAETEGSAPDPAVAEDVAAGPATGDGADGEERPRGRRSRRATRNVVTASFSSVAAEAPAQVTRAAERPAPALFQAPDLVALPSAPMIRAIAAAAPEGDEDGSDATTEDAQAPAGRRSRRATRAAGAPSQGAETQPASDLPASDLSTGATSSATGPEEFEQSEDDDDQPRRRRRRGGRRRRRPGGDTESQDGVAEGEGAPAPGQADESDDTGSASDEQAGEGVGSATEAGTSQTRAGQTRTGQGRSGEKQTGEAPAGAESGEAGAGDDEEAGAGRRRRRRRRRAGVAEEMEDLSVDDPPNTVTKVRESRRPSDEVTGLRGSTRIEAKKQRRRDGREAGRRRAPILTEAEFLARRESVNRVMCVRQHTDRTQIAVLEDNILVEHYVNRADSSSMVGNVYLGRVQNVLPSMEAAFVDVGRGRNAVLYAGEVNWDAAGLDGQPKRIELALKSGDPVLVQVTKDPIGHKGARLTSQISLPGRFLVYVPEGSMTGISRKLPDTERARLKGILKDVVPEGAGVIVRTAAEGATEEQLTADVRRLTEQWTDIQRKAKSSTPPTLLYGEPDLAIKVVRDIFNEDFTTLFVQGAITTRTLSDYIGRVAPDLLGRVQEWTDSDDLYAAHRIDEQIAKALDRKVWLPSGGSLVIDRTEAMTVVDVNTGKFTGQGGNLEETVTRNNLEAAEEIVRQLRLRDIGGIIVIDFIDMVLESNRDLVLRRLVECLGRDRTRHQVAEVTSLGLVQMTRKRIGQGLLEVFSTPCEACGGRGHTVHTEPVGSSGEESGRPRERGNGRRTQRPAPQVNLGGKQTGKTPPPPKFDEHGHIDHSADHLEAADEGLHDADEGGAEAAGSPGEVLVPSEQVWPAASAQAESAVEGEETTPEAAAGLEPVSPSSEEGQPDTEPEQAVEPAEAPAVGLGSAVTPAEADSAEVEPDVEPAEPDAAEADSAQPGTTAVESAVDPTEEQSEAQAEAQSEEQPEAEPEHALPAEHADQVVV